MRPLLPLLLTFCVLAAPAAQAAGSEAGQYQTTAAFLEQAFPGGAPASQTLWVKGDLRQSIEAVLGHRFGSLRVRYWHSDSKSAWILDEIGKELPITIGVAVVAGEIGDVQILEFRESRGWEVRYPFFTDQFRDARLDDDGSLDRNIDGITGATLSVKAVTRIARVALILHESLESAQ